MVKDDEKFLEGINLITGDKIDYSRNILVTFDISSPNQRSWHCASMRIYLKLTSLCILFRAGKKYKSGLFLKISLCTLQVFKLQKLFSTLFK